MAVSFKVPASPKKNIFVIDQFRGVDFTDTETNVDDNKSPNAENMVRLVPGKVRKRTGYKTRLLFADTTDVNRAIKSSDRWSEYHITATTRESGYVLSTFYDLIPANTNVEIRFEVEFVGSYSIDTYPQTKPGGYWSGTGTVEEPHKAICSLNSYTTAGTISDIRVWRTAAAGDDDYFKIREIQLCFKKSASSAEKMEWSAAPEDTGAKYIKRSTTDPVYGCHILKAYNANRVINVNRALNTSDTNITVTAPTSPSTATYELGEYLYKDNDSSIRVYVEFDYTATAAFKVVVGGGESASIASSNSEKHYSGNFSAGSYTSKSVFFKSISGTSTLTIKKFSVMYQKDSNYTWSAAPEDSGLEFHIEDVYGTDAFNYAAITDFYESNESTSLYAESTATIGSAASYVSGFGHLEFDLETSTSQDITKIELVFLSNTSTVLDTIEFTQQVNQHFDMYLATNRSSGEYFAELQVKYYLDSADATCLTYFKNISVKRVNLKSDYTSFAKNYIYHVGKIFYMYSTTTENITTLYSDANQHRSQSWQLNDRLIILDGKKIYSYEYGKPIELLTSGDGYIPLVTISKDPSGGGTSYEALNMLQPGFYEQFYVTAEKASATAFHLSFSGLDANPGNKPVKAWILNSNGNWVEKREGTDFNVNRSTGVVTFTSAPGQSPITGQDNVRILAYRTVPGYMDRVAKCTIGTLFGVGGASDTLFLSGNPDHPNWDFFSGRLDPTYFPDTGYSIIGSAASSIIGYALINNYLATFKDEYDPSQNVTIRAGSLILDTRSNTYEPSYTTVNTLQGNGVVSSYSFGYLQTEPLFLTRAGIYAITAQDITGEKYSQNRSFYLNGKLLKESDLDSAMATVFDEQYILAINGKLYILDGLQSIHNEMSMPYATRQYAGFYCTNVPASFIWTDEQALWVGTFGGRVCRFDTDIDSLDSYNDDGRAIYCCWDTPDLDGNLFYKNKTFRYFAIRIMNALRTSCRMYSKKLGAWTLIKEDNATGTIFDFNYIDFERFSFNTDTSAKVAHTKVRVKKIDKAQFRVENVAKNEPFGLYDLAIEYIESGNYKG